MKKYLMMLSFLLVSTFIMAQTKDEKSLSDAVDTLIQAMIRADKKVLESITADDLSYGHSIGKIENKAEFVDDIMNGTFHYLSGNVSDQTIKITKDAGVVRHVFTFKYKNDAGEGEMKLGVLLVWQKQNGKWKLLARQGYKLQ